MGNGRLLRRLPNILTLMNMSLGLSAVLVLLQTDHPYKAFIAPILIVLGGVADFFDGFLARKLNAVSGMGKQLDSFADLITFGVAPILLINYISACESFVVIIVASLIYIMAGAYRLARFNLADFSKHFLGLPIPAAGIALVVYSVTYPLWITPDYANIRTIITTAFIILLSAMMVSKKKIKRIAAHDEKVK